MLKLNIIDNRFASTNVEALATYLCQKRQDLLKESCIPPVSPSQNSGRVEEGNSSAIAARIIDTALLRLYVMEDSPLLASLVRIKNHCDIRETEHLLLDREKFDDLCSFYCSHCLYREALVLLKEYENFIMKKPANIHGIVLTSAESCVVLIAPLMYCTKPDQTTWSWCLSTQNGY